MVQVRPPLPNSQNARTHIADSPEPSPSRSFGRTQTHCTNQYLNWNAEMPASWSYVRSHGGPLVQTAGRDLALGVIYFPHCVRSNAGTRFGWGVFRGRHCSGIHYIPDRKREKLRVECDHIWICSTVKHVRPHWTVCALSPRSVTSIALCVIIIPALSCCHSSFFLILSLSFISVSLLSLLDCYLLLSLFDSFITLSSL